MSIRYTQPPDNAAEIVRAGLEQAVTAGITSEASDVGAPTPELTRPHDVYDIGADAVAAGGDVSAARLTSVRGLVGRGDSAVAVEMHEVPAGASGQPGATGAAGPTVQAEPRESPPPGSHALSQVNSGPYVGSTERELDRLEASAADSEADVEVRVLRCSALYFMALWLHRPDNPDHDQFRPLEPVPPGLEADRTYSLRELMAVLQPQAARLLSAHEPGMSS
ncbi:MAG: hypothetical protein IPK37_11370 [Austwickia sp.]|jgi:hypothetical protein|nr:MAG: hypothetical protein IPK37_11370 [Austwickia sp.]